LHCPDKNILGFFGIISRQKDGFSDQDIERAKMMSSLLEAAFYDVIDSLREKLKEEEKKIILKLTQDKLDISLERQSLIFNNIHEALIIFDDCGKIVDWNIAATKIFGYEKDEVLGKTLEFIINIEQEKEALSQIQQCIINKDIWHGKIKAIKKHDLQIYCEMNIMPLKRQNGEIIAVFSLGRDITEVR
jgi:PAS domain S-box-containing protein